MNPIGIDSTGSQYHRINILGVTADIDWMSSRSMSFSLTKSVRCPASLNVLLISTDSLL